MAFETVADYLSGITAYGMNLGDGESTDIMAGGWRRTSAPRVLANAALKASELNRQAEEMSFAAYAEGRGRAELEAEQQMIASLVSSGMNPATARQMIAERRATSLSTDLATTRGQLGQERAQREIGIIGETASGLIQSEQFQDSIDHREEMFQRQLAEQEKARKWGLVGNLVGAGLSFGLSRIGGGGSSGSSSGGSGGSGGIGGYGMPSFSHSYGNSPWQSGLNVNNYVGEAFTPFGAN